MSKKNIRIHIRESIDNGFPAEIVVIGITPGVLFKEQGTFVPFSNLGYNAEIGYFKLTDFQPYEESANEVDSSNPNTLHAGDYADGWKAFVWADDGGNLHLLGEKWEVADLYNVLREFILYGTLDDEIISEHDPAWRPLKWNDIFGEDE